VDLGGLGFVGVGYVRQGKGKVRLGRLGRLEKLG